MDLMPHQEKALELLDNGNILYGGVGTGKSRTAMAYYMRKESPRDIYIITTAKKRDSLDWVREAAAFGIGQAPDATVGGVLTVDSWNNIGRYEDVQDGFFIFDEQRLVGHGAWVKSFLKLSHHNRWILLSATPGDAWIDYAPVFIANGWYKNITDFKRQHVVYASYTKWPQITGYIRESQLERYRAELLVEVEYTRHTKRIMNHLDVGFNSDLIVEMQKKRWNPFTDEPMKNVAELWRCMRRVVNTDPSRLDAIRMLHKIHPRLIVWYNFDYELELLRTLETDGLKLEWNGHKHQNLPGKSSDKFAGSAEYLPVGSESSDVWLYFVQYQAGAEGWNCTTTDAMVFYSLTYSYKNWAQSQGRIDRLDTPFTDLYYYILQSGAYIDQKLVRTLDEKKDFNERNALKEWISHEYSANSVHENDK